MRFDPVKPYRTTDKVTQESIMGAVGTFLGTTIVSMATGIMFIIGGVILFLLGGLLTLTILFAVIGIPMVLLGVVLFLSGLAAFFGGPFVGLAFAFRKLSRRRGN
jgi:hypothetical protein